MTMQAEFNYWGNYYTVVLPDGSRFCCDNNDADRRELEGELREEGYLVVNKAAHTPNAYETNDSL